MWLIWQQKRSFVSQSSAYLIDFMLNFASGETLLEKFTIFFALPISNSKE